MKPFLVFGLRGTLVERTHVRNITAGMPAADYTVGLTKVWLRPHMMETLKALQQHCHLALWSSTTARNTLPLVDAVFQMNSNLSHGSGIGGGSSSSQSTASTSTTAAADGAAPGRPGSRFGKKGAKTLTSAEPAATTAAAEPQIKFEFIWSREHTKADEFRRANAAVRDDNHATVKDLTQVFEQFPHLAQPHNTILIDDTPSKAKLHADNFLWLDTCEDLRIIDPDGMLLLQKFIEQEILPTKDVRALLPQRIRSTASR